MDVPTVVVVVVDFVVYFSCFIMFSIYSYFSRMPNITVRIESEFRKQNEKSIFSYIFFSCFCISFGSGGGDRRNRPTKLGNYVDGQEFGRRGRRDGDIKSGNR